MRQSRLERDETENGNRTVKVKRSIGFALALVLLPSVAAAQIANTDHDFTTGGDAWDTAASLCETCHTPHSNASALAPLWGHATTTATFQVYASSTLDGTISAPDGVSKACLSCHDGTVAVRSGATLSGGALVGTDLRGDHPVSITYAGDAAMNTVASATAAGVVLYGTAGSETVECGSCHDPHSNAGEFLRSTTGDLCASCHNK